MAGVVKVFHSWRCVSDAVVAALSEPTTDPFVRPILVAPGNAQSRSLLQSLARRHGIAAGIDTTTPLGLRERLEEDLLGVKRENDPWQPGSLALRICRVIENNSPGFEVVSAHLEASRRQGVPRATWTTARQAADAICALARDSHDVLNAWADGATPTTHQGPWPCVYAASLRTIPPVLRLFQPIWKPAVGKECRVQHGQLHDKLQTRSAR